MPPSPSRPKSRVRLLPILGLVLLALALVAVDRWRRGAGGATARLDVAPEELVVPDYFDPIFFEGQGFPVHSRWVVEGSHTHGDAQVFVLPHAVEGLDYKNIQESADQVARVNAEYAPDPPWRVDDERRKGHYKCLSTAASLLVDWFALEAGAELEEYVSVLDGRPYRGLDAKALDSLYYRAAAREPELFVLTGDGHLDPISGVPVPYSAAGFVRLIELESALPGRREVPDFNLPREYAYSFDAVGPLRARQLVDGEIRWPVTLRRYPREASEELREELRLRGPLLAGIKVRFSAVNGIFEGTQVGDLPLLGVTGHGVLIVGWIERADRLYFLYRETFGRADEERGDAGPSWRIYPIYGFNEIFSFESA